MKKREERTEKFQLRLTTKAFNRIRILAREYAGGNVSAWVLYGALEAPRRYLVPKAKRPR